MLPNMTLVGFLWLLCFTFHLPLFTFPFLVFLYASIIMMQKSSARKWFCAEDWKMWRVKWYIQHAEASVLQEFPCECIFFEKKFLRAKIVPKITNYHLKKSHFLLILLRMSNKNSTFADKLGVAFLICP